MHSLPRPQPGAAVARAIRVVQPNIGQEDKWREGFADEAARRLASLSAGPGPEPRLLFWPEAAVTDPLEDARSGEHQALAAVRAYSRRGARRSAATIC